MLFKRYEYLEFEIYSNVVKKMLDQDKEAILIDARTKMERKEGYIPGSILIPSYEFDRYLELLNDKNRTIIVYCNSGGRSKEVVSKLRKLGYVNSYSMINGIYEWEYGIVMDRRFC